MALPKASKVLEVPQVLSIVSGKGGVGKTTLTSNLGVILASELGKRVLLIDGNFSTANLAIHLGFIKCPVAVQDIFDGAVKTNKAIYVHKSGLHLIPASLSMEHSRHEYNYRKASRRLLKAIAQVGRNYDFVLIDGAAGISGEARAAIAASGAVVIVTVPEVPTVTAAIKVVEVARSLGTPVFGIVVNRVRGGKVELSAEEIERVCGVPVVCSVPEDEAVRESTSLREPVCAVKPGSPAPCAIRSLAKKLCSGEEPKKKGIFSCLLTFLAGKFKRKDAEGGVREK